MSKNSVRPKIQGVEAPKILAAPPTAYLASFDLDFKIHFHKAEQPIVLFNIN